MTKIFAHRGFVTSQSQENSIASLREAHKENYPGVEFDVWSIENSLVINHDLPEKNIKKLSNFSEYLEFKNEIEYWIDFKNLDESNVVKAIEVVAQEIVRAKIENHKIYFAPFIENLDKAILIYKAIRHRIKDAQIMAVCEKLDPQNFASYHKELQKNHIKFLSINHEIIDEKFAKIFSDINLFAWTVNDITRLRTLQKLGVKNFASDIITPKML